MILKIHEGYKLPIGHNKVEYNGEQHKSIKHKIHPRHLYYSYNIGHDSTDNSPQGKQTTLFKTDLIEIRSILLLGYRCTVARLTLGILLRSLLSHPHFSLLRT